MLFLVNKFAFYLSILYIIFFELIVHRVALLTKMTNFRNLFFRNLSECFQRLFQNSVLVDLFFYLSISELIRLYLDKPIKSFNFDTFTVS